MINTHLIHLTPKCSLLSQVESDPDDRDAETRVAAVKALAAVAQKLFSPASINADSGDDALAHGQVVAADSAAAEGARRESSPGGLAADPAPAALVREHVMGALLVAVEDYSTDNRWVGMLAAGKCN